MQVKNPCSLALITNLKPQMFGSKIFPNITQTLGCVPITFILKFLSQWLHSFLGRNSPSRVGPVSSRNVLAITSHSQVHLGPNI